jgi:hypothetical protein
MSVVAAARGEFPFRLSRQILARPLGVGFCVPVGNMNDGVMVEPADR